MKELKLLVIGDFHYKKMMYPPTVANLSSVLTGGADGEIIIHTGDFCNDYSHSPELFERLFADGREVYGVYGNHELETEGNTMRIVTPLLTNSADKAVFGTEDGKMGDGDIAYYFVDRDGFRIIFLDTNYSQNSDGEWVHNLPASWGAPSGNTNCHSLGEVQLAWLTKVIDDAGERGLRCITVSHNALNSDINKEALDSDAVGDIFRRANEKRSGTVVLAVSGHFHTVGRYERDGVTYLDCPATINGWWQSKKFFPYAEESADEPRFTFPFESYDPDGKLIEIRSVPYSALRMGAQSLFYAEPVYTSVTVRESGEVESFVSPIAWAYGISPESSGAGM